MLTSKPQLPLKWEPYGHLAQGIAYTPEHDYIVSLGSHGGYDLVRADNIFGCRVLSNWHTPAQAREAAEQREAEGWAES